MSPSTIPEVIEDAEELYDALTGDLDISLDLPALELTTEFTLPTEGDIEGLEDLCPMTVDSLTTEVVGGSGVFDKMMKAVNAHLTDQFEKGRITGGDYAKVYLGSVQTVMQQAIAFLVAKDRTFLENLQLKETLKLTQLQSVRALADIELARAQIQIAQFTAVKTKLDAYTARNQYALSKMALVTGYNGVLASEVQVKLVGEQYETQRAQTRETNSDGDPIEGILKYEKQLKQAQAKLVTEQYESQRGQTLDTRSDDSTPIVGLLGAQRDLYNKQIWAYARDGEAKFIKMILDTWTARKTIDDGVAVPDEIDTDKIDEVVDQARANLEFTG